MSSKKLYIPGEGEIEIGSKTPSDIIKGSKVSKEEKEREKLKEQIAETLLNDLELKAKDRLFTGDSAVDNKLRNALQTAFYKLTTGGFTSLDFYLINKDTVDYVKIDKQKIYGPWELEVISRLHTRPYDRMLITDTTVDELGRFWARLWIIQKIHSFLYLIPLKRIARPKEGDYLTLSLEKITDTQLYEIPTSRIQIRGMHEDIIPHFTGHAPAPIITPEDM